MSEKDYALQTNLWHSNARSVVAALLSLDILGWHGEHYIVIRSDKGRSIELKKIGLWKGG